MSRRARCWSAASLAVISLLVAAPVSGEEAPLEPTPSTQPTATAAPSEPAPTAPEPGAVDGGGEVTLPNPDAPAPHAPRVLVFGDSISSLGRYSINGHRKPKVWWSHLAESTGVPARQIMVSAEGGSGLLARGSKAKGNPCTGTTFGERMDEIAATDPDVLIVEVGRNDVNTCSGRMRVRSIASERRAAATTYFDKLARMVDRQGVKRSNVYVLSPWGTAFSKSSVAITTLYETTATAHGFTWVPTPALTRQHTMDLTHPNNSGARLISNAVLRSSDIATSITSAGGRNAAVDERAQVRCTGLRQCRDRGVRTHRIKTAPTTIWGARAGTSRHYAAHRLTRGRSTAPVLSASRPRQWRTATTREQSALQYAHAKVGDVAWWRQAPAGVGKPGQGHVAIVEKVAGNNSWVLVSEVTSRGHFRSVRYSGASLPRAYLRFKRTTGGPRGIVSSARAERGTLTVRGRAVDTDAPQRRIKIKVVVTQRGRTWIRTAPQATRVHFAHRFALRGLKPGRATVRVIALDAPGTRGTSRKLDVCKIMVARKA